MSLAAALAAHNLRTQRASMATSPLPTVSEATQLEGCAVDSDDDSVPSLTAASSFCSSTCSSSFESRTFPDVHVLPIISKPSAVKARPAGLRRNEYLAVLLPQQLWKLDSQTSRCDTFACRRRFTLLERKHHCRRCGGIFCSACSSRTTALLDTTHLDFLHPPKNVPITAFHSPQSIVASLRVCDECYYLLHGRDDTSSSSHDSLHSVSRPASTSTRASELEPRPPMRRANTEPSAPIPRPRRARTSSTASQMPSTPSTSSTPTPTKDLGDLEYYPLRFPTAVCKAMGGGRWTPKPVRNWEGHRIPGGKAPFEIALEREAEKERLRRLNPVIRDGEFRMRVPRQHEPTREIRPQGIATF